MLSRTSTLKINPPPKGETRAANKSSAAFSDSRLVQHHSRDSAHKQWSETRVLTLQGLGRLLRAATASPAAQGLTPLQDAQGGEGETTRGGGDWFGTVWRSTLALGASAVQVGSSEQEVALAGLALLLALLQLCSLKGAANDPVKYT